MKVFVSAFKRTLALMIAEASTIIAGGSILGAKVWLSACLAALAAALTVSGELARAYYKDGKLDDGEVNEIFEKK